MNEGINASLTINKRRRNLRLQWILLEALVRKEFQARYRRSLLGPLWAILHPLCYMLLFVCIRKMLGLSKEGWTDIVHVYCSLALWTYLSGIITRCGPSIYTNASLVKKIPLPRETFLIASVIVSLADFLISSSILALMIIIFQIHIGLEALWCLPIILLTSILGFGLGLGFAAIGTFKRDILLALPLLLQVWLLATPILYPLDKVPGKWVTLYSFNPAVGLISGFNQALMNNTPPDFSLLAISSGGLLIITLICWPLFRYLSQYFADSL